jgi:hypothetical protein
MTEAEKLVKAVRRILPLGDLRALDTENSGDLIWFASGDDHNSSEMLPSVAMAAVVGLILAECARRRWIAQLHPGGESSVTIWTGPEWEQRHRSAGTDALAWCEAFRKAKEANDVATH